MLFPGTPGGGHLHSSALYDHYYAARRKAGRQDLRWHDLRHTGLTFAGQSGATLAELMARAGHSSAATALRYQHSTQSRDRMIAEQLSALATNVTSIETARRRKAATS